MLKFVDLVLDFLVPPYRQVILSILLSVVFPIALWNLTLDEIYMSEIALFSAGSSIVATIFSYFFIFQFRQHPVTELPFYLIVAHTMSFMFVVFIIFIFRFEYSITIIVSAYIIATLFSLLIIPAIGRHGRIQYAIIPGGRVHQLERSGLISFRILTKPDEVVSKSEHIVADLSFKHSPEWGKFLADCALSDHEIHSHTFVQEQVSGRMTIDRLSENAMGTLLPSKTYLTLKMLADYLICLIAFLPVVLLIGGACLAILMSEGGPALFRQKRIGFRGKAFTAYKLRTMRHEVNTTAGSREARDAAMTLTDDPRITRLGAILRKYRIDELPQIFNILRGEMSWIGPRPEAVPLHDYYAEQLPFYKYRSVVRPGITGWAQVSQGHVTSVDEVLDKLKYDFYYIKYLSLSLDVIIILKTIRTVLLGSGAK